MKKLLLLTAFTFAVVGTMAQGAMNFLNYSTAAGVNGKVSKADGTLLGSEFMGGLNWGMTETSLNPLASLAVAFRDKASDKSPLGYVTSTVVNFAGITAGTTIWVQMTAWESAKGATYDAALNAGGLIGKSNPFQIKLTEAPAAPAAMTGIQPFSVAVIPEPSVLALGVLGGVAFLLRRRS